MNKLLRTLNEFEGVDSDSDRLIAREYEGNELFISVSDSLDDVSASFIFENNEADFKKAKQLLEVIQSYINRSSQDDACRVDTIWDNV